MTKKAIAFTTDALMATTLILIATMIVFSQSTTTQSESYTFEQTNSISSDAIKILSSIELSEINETLKNDILSGTNITTDDLNKDMIYIIGALWAENSTASIDYAKSIAEKYIRPLIPDKYSYGIYINDQEIHAEPKTEYNVLSSTRRLISGINKGSPTKGTSTRITISNILSKDTSKFIYFGGFVGEGNITKAFTLPSSIENVKDVYIEVDAGSNFTISVNGNDAGNYTMTSMTPMHSNNWTMNSTYYPLFTSGDNTININYTDLQNSYIGGGYIKIAYNTSIMDTTMISSKNGNTSERYDFPGIAGFINLYSSFYVPGTLNSMHIYLHLDNPYTTYLYIGKTEVYDNITNETEYININNTILSSILDYGTMSKSTIPIRLGIKNLTGLNTGSNIILITDLSESMDTFDVQPGNLERIAVAKSSDKEFVDTILNNEYQKVGLVGYGTSTDSSRTVYLTDNNETLKTEIDGYDHDQGMTCISCGIKTSTDMLKATINVTTIVENGTQWYYNDSYRDSEPPTDSYGYNWYEPNYTLESEWNTDYAVFGAGAAALPKSTDLATGSSGGTTAYPNLWDDNTTTIPVSFETGYNSTANTFGWNNGDDGWDYDPEDNSGPYGYDDNIDYNFVVNEKLEFDTVTGAPARNRCDNKDCSAAYGIQIEITPEHYNILSNNGMARISFQYEWDGNDDPFENSDEVWIKSRWTSPTTGIHDLGTEQSNIDGDTTPEIDFRDNPNDDIPPTYTAQDITSWIEGPGTYYLDIGGKLYAGVTNEWGYFRFDDILLEIRNGTSRYYFRKNFTITDMNKIGRGFLKVASDDISDIFINGELIDSDPGPSHDADYWNRIELIDRSYFKEGNNIIAARSYNSAGATRFDLKVETFNTSRNRAMLVMSDGEANHCYPPIWNCPDSQAKQQAIDFACEAYETYGIQSHAVGFGSTVDEATLQSIADCGHGIYRSSNNADELKEIYQNIANAMVSYQTQNSNIIGTYTITTLYADSYIEYNYTPTADLNYGEISLTFESPTFGETSGNPDVESPKNGSYWIPPTVEVVDSKATTYSSDYWSSILDMKSETSAWTNIYNLSTYQEKFTKLGDPYIIYMPPSLIEQNKTNYVRIDTGINDTYFTGASPNNRIIYTLKIKGTASYSEISSKADGCEWKVEQYDGNNATLKIPTNYNGTKTCEFSSEQIIYDSDDSIDNAGILLLQQLDVTDDNRIDVAIDQTNINIRIIKVRDIPWMWGPAIFKLEIWK